MVTHSVSTKSSTIFNKSKGITKNAIYLRKISTQQQILRGIQMVQCSEMMQ